MKKYLLFIFIGCFSLFSLGQEECISDKLHQAQLAKNPILKQQFENWNKMVSKLGERNEKAGTVYRVPIVIHVMHKGEAVGTGTNISDQDIYDGVRLINQLFRKEAGSKGDGNGVDVEVEFALAVRDTNDNCTNGIVRYDMSGNATYMSSGVYVQSSGISENTLKSLSVWDQTKYYNIWLVSEIDNNGGGSGIQGFAYYSSSHGQPLDGAIFLAEKFAIEGNTTATHELGHAMNLAHTFNGDANGTSCPANADCTVDGDYICDTPPHIRSGSDCVIGTNSCDGGTSTELFIHNYMDYSSDDCQSEFTAGQKTRVQAALLTDRASFLESNGNMSLVPPSVATANFRVSSTIGCTGSTISFYDSSSCTPNTFQNGAWNGITFSWTFDNGVDTPITSTLQNPTITFTNAGTYTVTHSVTNSYGTNTIVKNSAVIVANSPTAATCQPTTSNDGVGAYGIGIYNVTLNTINNSTEVTDTIYTDYSCTDNTTLQPSTSYNISMTGDGGDGQWWRAYIDYNNNGTFEAGELIASNDNTTNTFSTSFTAPASGSIVMNTMLRMRVITDWYGTGRPMGPCSDPLDDGQAEDYGVIFRTNTTDPEISFISSTTGASETFTADGNNNCRPYKDYQITMSIASAPTGDAIVTPVIDSSSADSLDYELLNTPLTFTDGATTNQSFTIRVYDDAVIENDEKIYLSFNISGSTDALKGGGSLTHVFTISNNDVSPTASTVNIWSEDWETGGGFTIPADWTVIEPSTGDRNVWYIDGASSCGYEISNKTMIVIHYNDTAASYYCGYNNYAQSPMYFYRQVDATGLSNITVDFNYKAVGESGQDYGELIYATNPSGPWTSVATYVGQSGTQAASEDLPSSLDNSVFYIGWRFTNNTSIRNNPGFSIDDIVVQGMDQTPIEANITPNTDEQYLGPLQTIYYYNPDDGDLMVKVENTSTHDYGCTTVEVDREGTSASLFQYNTVDYYVTDKSFKIIPANNNLTGSYNITLYFTEAEISGWETATGRLRSEIEVVKTKDSIPGVTPASPKTTETFYTTGATQGAFGSDFYISGSYSNGFSGFAAGINGAGIMDLEEILLDGYVSVKGAELNWKGFDRVYDKFIVERSSDGKKYEQIARMDGSSFNFIDSEFEFMDLYRIKGFSGKKQFISNVIELEGKNVFAVKLYPNPVTDQLNLHITGTTGHFDVEIYNNIGQEVYEMALEENTGNIMFPFRGMPSGIYTIKVRTKKHLFVDKIIKK